ncbi:hypothetical protein [Siphonobacter sp.]|uniref:hypothetical protein n=1 Tax=Siphonobacter sp. TaxID=1869184 RepID=UPI003B3A3893
MKYLLILSAFVLLGSVAFTTRIPAEATVGRVWADSVKKDPETGLAVDSNLPLIKAHCTACHSSKLITQNKFTRTGWVDKIRWMQKYHKLWDLGPSEVAVLDYLEKYYGPSKQTFDGRRKPLEKPSWYKLR